MLIDGLMFGFDFDVFFFFDGCLYVCIDGGSVFLLGVSLVGLVYVSGGVVLIDVVFVDVVFEESWLGVSGDLILNLNGILFGILDLILSGKDVVFDWIK